MNGRTVTSGSSYFKVLALHSPERPRNYDKPEGARRTVMSSGITFPTIDFHLQSTYIEASDVC
jgi:hypothetical protein